MLTRTDDLTTAIEVLRRDGLAALDTEFVWDRTFFPHLGIVQLGGAPGHAWLLDALAPDVDTSPLAALLTDAGTVKILHDARQDLTILARFAHATPRNVFDTRIAAGFAGLSSTTSLQQLLRDVLGVELAKTETRTDWCRRPLSEAQLDYALDDVRHLAAVRDALLTAVRERGAEAWLAEELRAFDDPALYADRPLDEAWDRVKGAGRLSPAARAILRELAALRETFAARRNLPRNWLIPDEVLVSLSEQPPVDLAALQGRKLLPPHQLAVLGDELLAALERGRATPKSDWPAPPNPRLDEATKRRADEALAFLRERATTLRIDSALFGSRAQITAFVQNPADPSHPLSQGWRFETAGRDLAARWPDAQLRLL